MDILNTISGGQLNWNSHVEFLVEGSEVYCIKEVHISVAANTIQFRATIQGIPSLN